MMILKSTSKSSSQTWVRVHNTLRQMRDGGGRPILNRCSHFNPTIIPTTSRSSSTSSTAQYPNAIHKCFEILQEKYGGFQSLLDSACPIVQRTDGILRTEDVQKVVTHEILALHIKNYLDPLYAQQLGQQLCQGLHHSSSSSHDTKSNPFSFPLSSTTTGPKKELQNWMITASNGRRETSDVYTLGEHVPYNVAYSMSQEPSPNMSHPPLDEYYNGVWKELKERKQQALHVLSSPLQQKNCDTTSSSSSSIDPSPNLTMIVPQLHPMDKLRLELDEVWPAGAGLAKEPETTHSRKKWGSSFLTTPNTKKVSTHRRPKGAGLPRIMIGPTRWRNGYIHVDDVSPLSIHSGSFSANIYLQLPSKTHPDNHNIPHCGELILWPLQIRNRWDWYRNAILLSSFTCPPDPDVQYRLRKELLEPHVVPLDPGDLVFFSVQRPHAAVGFRQGIRVSLQSFIQHDGPKERLLMDI